MKHFFYAAALFYLALSGTSNAVADEGFAGLEMVPVAELGNMRGKLTLVPSDLDLMLPDTDSGSTRTNTIQGSFANGAGIATIVQNSGNNVIIQTSTIVTINYK